MPRPGGAASRPPSLPVCRVVLSAALPGSGGGRVASPRIPSASGGGARGVRAQRPLRGRDARRAAEHHRRLARQGLRRWASPFTPADYPVGGGAGYVPGNRGRRGRKALLPLRTGWLNRRHALPSSPSARPGAPSAPNRGLGGTGSAGGVGLVSWAMRLPRLLRATRCSLSSYLASTMQAPAPGLRARAGDPLPCPPRSWVLPPLPRLPQGRPAWAQHCAAHVWTNCIVAALSHLAMGRASAAPPHAVGGAPQSAAQAAMWESVHERVRLFLRDAKNVSGGAKLATAEAEVAELERLLEVELQERGGYGDGVRGKVLHSDGGGFA